MGALKRWLTHPVTIRVSQVVIGAIFAVAALAKLGDLHAFAEQVHNFRLLPLGLENLVAMMLPWVELVAGLALIFGIRARSGAWIAALLMAGFTVGVLLAMARGLDIECGCFGTADATRVGVVKVVENFSMMALAVVAGLRRR
jgi:uncharacterized membrane protein YphA (DoxX/SURF4 family)